MCYHLFISVKIKRDLSMFHHLIMVTGSCPGSGKSTMTEFLAKQMTAQGIYNRLILEEDVARLEVFASMRPNIQKKSPDMINALLTASKTLIMEYFNLPCVYIIDTLLPGYHFLFGLYPFSSLAKYNAELHRRLLPLKPIIVYLKSDINCALGRVVEERGEEWLGQFMGRINRHYQKGHYTRISPPLRGLRDVVAFFAEMDKLMLEMVKDWQGKTLVIDTLERTVDEIKNIFVDSLLRSEAT